MPRLLSDFSLILVIGPDMLWRCPDCPETELFGLVSAALEGLDLKAVMLCETPEARVNCSRSSTFVRPLARHGSFLIRNSSKAIQPPPTRTMTVDRRIRTRRSFWESPKRYLPSPTWNTLNFCRQVQRATWRLISSSIRSISVSGPLSCQSGLRAAINSRQSIMPSP